MLTNIRRAIARGNSEYGAIMVAFLFRMALRVWQIVPQLIKRETAAKPSIPVYRRYVQQRYALTSNPVQQRYTLPSEWKRRPRLPAACPRRAQPAYEPPLSLDAGGEIRGRVQVYGEPAAVAHRIWNPQRLRARLVATETALAQQRLEPRPARYQRYSSPTRAWAEVSPISAPSIPPLIILTNRQRQ